MKVHSNHLFFDTYPSRQSLASCSLLLIILAIAVPYTVWSVSPLRAAQSEQSSAAIGPTTNPYSQNALTPYYKQAARYILEQTGYDQKKGYCFVFGAAKGQLAYEIVKRSDLYLFATEQDENNINLARNKLLNANLYGNRIVLHKGSLDKLRYNDYAATLVISDTILSQGK